MESNKIGMNEMERYKEAKEIYLKYGGNFFHMDREGDGEKYQAFHVSKEIEKQWDEEIKNNLMDNINKEKDFSKIELDIFSLFDIVVNTNDLSRFIWLYNLLSKYDTYVDLLIIEKIFDSFIRFYKNDKEKVEQIMLNCLNVLNNMLLKPIVVSKDYYQNKEKPIYLRDEYIIERIKKDIKIFTQTYEDREHKLADYKKVLKIIEDYKKRI